ncbi:FecCD family ABC transporter permease [Streptomyces sp. 8N114]|uniref:FecCD family ABC transporter permease n=1 Tax=Streptomyces sp. 8N114 TaxID=3457419 RepID=UPI003FD4C6D2
MPAAPAPRSTPTGAPTGAPIEVPAGAPADGSGRAAPERPRRAVARRLAWLLAGAVALALAALLSLALGSRTVPPSAVWDALLHGGHSNSAEVVRTLRVPRTLVGVMVGAALGLAGTVMQGLTRNPIAEPGILGVSQGAGAGVLCAIAFAGVHSLSGYVWFGFVGAGVAAVAVYAVAARGRGGATPVKLALSGAAVNALLVALVSGILTTRAAALDEFRFWQVGSLSDRDATIAGQVWPFLVAGALLVFSVARGLDALALGDDMARGLGQRVAAVRIVGGLGATVLTGTGVAAAGPIAFVGLAVPHMARALVGTGHRWLLPMAALLGPVVLLVSDVVGRLVMPPGEVPAGVMTALVGAPFLVALVRRRAVAA